VPAAKATTPYSKYLRALAIVDGDQSSVAGTELSSQKGEPGQY
jgi:hypothetical protein